MEIFFLRSECVVIASAILSKTVSLVWLLLRWVLSQKRRGSSFCRGAKARHESRSPASTYRLTRGTQQTRRYSHGSLPDPGAIFSDNRYLQFNFFFQATEPFFHVENANETSDVQGSAQACRPSRAGTGFDQTGPSPGLDMCVWTLFLLLASNITNFTCVVVDEHFYRWISIDKKRRPVKW
jgi:hypothetical protein